MNKVDISQVDALFSNGRYPIEFLFYFPEAVPTRRVRRALRRLAPVFWPAFGKYDDGTIFFDRYREEDCFDEDIFAGELDVPETEKAGPEVISRFGLKEMDALFFLKMIQFKNGTVLIPKLQHVAGDGYSYFAFLSVLAALAKSSRVPFKSLMVKSIFKPHHNRTALKPFSFRGEKLEPDILKENLTMASDEVPRQEVQALIREAASSHKRRISSNDVLTAMMVKKLAGIQGGLWGENVRLAIPIDVRRQIKEYGARFFGNGIMLHNVLVEKKRIENSPIGEIAAEIRGSMPAVTRENFVEFLGGLERMISERNWEEFRPFDVKQGCLVTNLSRLPAERLDFGTGCPQSIVPLTIEESSAAILARKENFVLRYAH